MGFLSRLLPTSHFNRAKRELLQAVHQARPAGIELQEDARIAAVITALLQSPEGVELSVVRSGETVTLCHRADLEGRMSVETKSELQRGSHIINSDHWSIRR